MRNILFIILLMFSVTMFGQNITISVEQDSTKQEMITKTTLCIPIVTITDSLYILKCQGIYMEIPINKFQGHITYVIIPNTRKVLAKKIMYLPMPPEEDYNYK